MIKFVPKWSIIGMYGLYFVCKKPGGPMEAGRTIEEAKQAWLEEWGKTNEIIQYHRRRRKSRHRRGF